MEGRVPLKHVVLVRIQLRQLNAAAHGCGPAFVRRETRVGTGRRLEGPR